MLLSEGAYKVAISHGHWQIKTAMPPCHPCPCVVGRSEASLVSCVLVASVTLQHMQQVVYARMYVIMYVCIVLVVVTIRSPLTTLHYGRRIVVRLREYCEASATITGFCLDLHEWSNIKLAVRPVCM